MNNRQKGYLKEALCVDYLEKLDFSILTTNGYTPFGEIDIISEYNDVIYFIEVKSSRSSIIDPVFKINAKKMHSMKQSAIYYMTVNQLDKQMQFDLITVTKNKLRHYNNIITS